MDAPDVIRAALEESSRSVEALMDGMQEPAVKQELIANTVDSVTGGVCGSASFSVGDELFFGKDTLGDVEREIARQGDGCPASAMAALCEPDLEE